MQKAQNTYKNSLYGIVATFVKRQQKYVQSVDSLRVSALSQRSLGMLPNS